MAPLKDTDTASSETIKTLVSLIASSSEFNPDYNVVAKEVGISHAKNVPRKLDSILKPYGYQIKSKKIVKLGEDTPATPVQSAAKSKGKAEPRTPGGSDSSEDEMPEVNGSPVKKKKTPAKKAATPKERKTPVKKAATTPKRTAKKRKLEEIVKGEDEDEEDVLAEDVNGFDSSDADSAIKNEVDTVSVDHNADDVKMGDEDDEEEEEE